MTDRFQQPYFGNQLPTQRIPATLGQEITVEPAIQPTQPDKFEPTGDEANGKRLKSKQKKPKKPKKSMIPMVVLTVVALTGTGFGIWAVTHKEDAGKLLDNAKEGVNKLFKKTDKPDNTVEPPSPNSSGGGAGAGSTGGGAGGTSGAGTGANGTVTPPVTPPPIPPTKVTLNQGDKPQWRKLMGGMYTLNVFQTQALEDILNKPAKEMTIEQFYQISNLEEKILALPDSQVVLFATHIVDALSNPESVISKGAIADLNLWNGCMDFLVSSNKNINYFLHSGTSDNLCLFTEVVRYLSLNNALPLQNQTIGRKSCRDYFSAKDYKLLENFEAYVKNPADITNQAHLTTLFVELKTKFAAVAKEVEAQKASTVPPVPPAPVAPVAPVAQISVSSEPSWKPLQAIQNWWDDTFPSKQKLTSIIEKLDADANTITATDFETLITSWNKINKLPDNGNLKVTNQIFQALSQANEEVITTFKNSSNFNLNKLLYDRDETVLTLIENIDRSNRPLIQRATNLENFRFLLDHIKKDPSKDYTVPAFLGGKPIITSLTSEQQALLKEFHTFMNSPDTSSSNPKAFTDVFAHIHAEYSDLLKEIDPTS